MAPSLSSLSDLNLADPLLILAQTAEVVASCLVLKAAKILLPYLEEEILWIPKGSFEGALSFEGVGVGAY